MKYIFSLSFVLFFNNPIPAQIAVIPQPAKVTYGSGYFIFSRKTKIVSEVSDPGPVRFFNNYVTSGKKITEAASQNQLLITEKGSGNLPAEGYRITVIPSRITVTGKGAGLFYGIQTLMQLFPDNTKGTAVLPAVTIEDEPRFSYRGLMLDVSRHFFTVQQVKDLLDLMAAYKLNRFHWHLTDDQGWRIEIKSYPRLTTVGAWRVPRKGYFDGNILPPQPGEKATDGGFYTQEQIKEVVRYAAERHIEVIPEIDVPGHSMAAIAAYPELCVTQDTSIKVNPGSSFAKWFPDGHYEMYIDNTLNPINEKVYIFLDKVFTEVAALFPYEYIHIGGDECFKGYWQKDPGIQNFMKTRNIKDMHELQSYFISRVNAIVQSKHKKLIGWDEILDGGLKDGVAVMNRFGEKGAIKQTKDKRSIVLAPGNNGLYFDYAQSASDMEPINHGGNSPLWKSYEYNPESVHMTAEDRKYIMGVEACIWTEHIPSMQKLQYMILPRLFGLSETAWSLPGNKNYQKFESDRLQVHLERLDRAGVIYRVPAAFNYTDTTLTGGRFVFTPKSLVPGAKIYYTLSNRIPTEADLLYDGSPLEITVPAAKKMTLRTVVVTPAGRRSIATRTVMDNTKP